LINDLSALNDVQGIELNAANAAHALQNSPFAPQPVRGPQVLVGEEKAARPSVGEGQASHSNRDPYSSEIVTQCVKAHYALNNSKRK
jgi:hypothetical protein